MNQKENVPTQVTNTLVEDNLLKTNIKEGLAPKLQPRVTSSSAGVLGQINTKTLAKAPACNVLAAMKSPVTTSRNLARGHSTSNSGTSLLAHPGVVVKNSFMKSATRTPSHDTGKDVHQITSSSPGASVPATPRSRARLAAHSPPTGVVAAALAKVVSPSRAPVASNRLLASPSRNTPTRGNFTPGCIPSPRSPASVSGSTPRVPLRAVPSFPTALGLPSQGPIYAAPLLSGAGSQASSLAKLHSPRVSASSPRSNTTPAVSPRSPMPFKDRTNCLVSVPVKVAKPHVKT